MRSSRVFAAVVAVTAGILLVLPSATMAQSSPGDDANPPWKEELSRLPTPHTSDGKPDLNGTWQAAQNRVMMRLGRGLITNRSDSSDAIYKGIVDEQGNVKATREGRGVGGIHDDGAGGFINYQRDNGLALNGESNKPLYRPEHWERVQWLDENGNTEDPELGCKPLGVPRMGPPDRIVQTPKELFFIYRNYNNVRIIPMNKPLPPVEKWEGTSWYGTPYARWEGDTLVIESADFTENSWLGYGGYFHTVNMRVTERYTRRGNVLTWQATVDDPEALLQPWVQNPHYLRLGNAEPVGEPKEVTPCGDLSRPHMVTKERG